MSDQPPSSSAMARPFRFWLPYRSNVALSPPASSRAQPPSPTPAEPALRPSPVRAVEEDIPIQAESSSDESDMIPVQAFDSLQLRGARSSMADLELTLSRPPPPPPTGQQQDPSDRGNDTKITISGFPRARLFDGARAPYRREIEDGLKSLADRETPARRPPDSGSRVITLAGHNVGASMVLGNGSSTDAPVPVPRIAAEPGGLATAPAIATNVNSNVQSVNNSTMEGSTCNAGDPGVHVGIENAHKDPAVLPPSKEEEEKQPRAPPPPGGNISAEAVAVGKTPPRIRRCLRALMLETKKPKPSACRFQCVTDHAPPPPPAMASDGAEERAGGARAEVEA